MHSGQLHRPRRRQRPERCITRVSVGGRTLRIHHLREIDSLLDEMDQAALKDEKIPYYGEIWPASIGLARWLGRNVPLGGRRFLDLGCGAGLSGVAAGVKGAFVSFADYFQEALALAARNARCNGLQNYETLHVDWRDRSWVRPYDLIAGCDVIYELRHHEPILDLLERCLRPGGRAYLSDPGRVHLEGFVSLARARGFALERDAIAIQEGGERVTEIHILELAPPASHSDDA